MSNECIKKIVRDLQRSIAASNISDSIIGQSIESLEEIGYRYAYDLFPEIPVERKFSTEIGDAPGSLAEALLWKMGKWNIYKEFVRNYETTSDPEKKTDVVFASFAKHLMNRNKPIYDQHALRALWAIDENISKKDCCNCRSTLLNSKGKSKDEWKSNMSGSKTIECYQLYVHRMSVLCNVDVSYSKFDQLLMPLGQAIKENFKTYDSFERLRNR